VPRQTPMKIDNATESDLPEIVAIYNEVIATSTAVFSEQPTTIERQREAFDRRRPEGYPVIVARERGAVLGFGSYGPFRTWPGYRLTVEHSVYVATPARRRGIGRRLVEELLERARAQGMHVIIAGIDAENAPSLRMHEQLGFERVACLPEVARKFDRWLDLVLLQLIL
jgi:L-amino acid N-acyltransferase